MKYEYKDLVTRYRLDEESPSGIVWNQDRYAGEGYLILMAEEGEVAGSPSSGYWLVCKDDEKLACHRIVFCLHNGVDLTPDEQIDHVDGNPLNNRIENLRKVANTGNSRNRRKRVDSKTGVTGVCLRANNSGRKYYQAYWSGLDGKQKYGKRYYTDVLVDTEALQSATTDRSNAISQLNASGAGYTIRHGN